MLLQIAEPGESSKKEACPKRVVGIDLGTTHSLVAYVREGSPQSLPDEDGDVLLPSVVYYPKTGTPVVGKSAVLASLQYPQDTIVSVKRFMGRALSDVSKEATGSYLIENNPNESVVRFRVKAASHSVTPVEVSAEILRTLKERAEHAMGGAIDGAVITVPAYFDEAQRQATKDAGRLAGLPVLRLLNEPTAAALAYGLDRRSQGRFAVYDLGGGTFDISILELKEGMFTVLATAGDTALGGDDMDLALAKFLISKHPDAALLESQMYAEPKMQRLLLSLAKKIKHHLTENESMTGITVGDLPFALSVHREEFESVITEILKRSSVPCRQALKDAELRPEELDGVILVGGATRVPAVRQYVAKLFHQTPLNDVDPDQVVALGAAIQAEVIANQRRDVLLIDVTPLSLGLVLMGDIVEKIIPRNSRIPIAAKQVFTTYAEGQTGFDLHIVQGERETVSGNRSLAHFQLTGISPMAAGMARLEVTFLVDENGLLQVSAKELISGKEAHIEVKPSYGLTEEQIEQMLLDSYEYAEADMQARLLSEQRIEAERVLSALRKALADDGWMISQREKETIVGASTSLEQSLLGSNAQVITTKIEELDRVSREFVEKRMNQKIIAAISGKSVQDLSK